MSDLAREALLEKIARLEAQRQANDRQLVLIRPEVLESK